MCANMLERGWASFFILLFEERSSSTHSPSFLLLSSRFELHCMHAAFSILPLVGYSNTIGDNALEMIQWRNIYDYDPAKREMDR